MKKKILVIEDEKNLLDDIKTLLEEENYTVFTASDGKRGISKAKEEKPDLIICDVMMPGIDGYEVLRTLSLNKNTKQIPFIF